MENNIVLKSLIETLMKQNKLEMWNIKPGKHGKIYLNACFGSLLSDNEAESQVEHSLNSSMYFKRKSDTQMNRDFDRSRNFRDLSNKNARPIRSRKQTQRYDSSIENPRREFDYVQQAQPFCYSSYFTGGLSPENISVQVPDPRLNPCVAEFVYGSPPLHAGGKETTCDPENAVTLEEESADVIIMPEIQADDHVPSDTPSSNESCVSISMESNEFTESCTIMSETNIENDSLSLLPNEKRLDSDIEIDRSKGPTPELPPEELSAESVPEASSASLQSDTSPISNTDNQMRDGGNPPDYHTGLPLHCKECYTNFGKKIANMVFKKRKLKKDE